MPELYIEQLAGDQDLTDAFAVRRIVFCEEQGIATEDDFDGRDEAADHFVGYLDSRPVATARVRYTDKRAKVERVAVLGEYRGKHYGAQLMRVILRELRKKPELTEAYLESQTYAKLFYERLGFSQISEEFDDVGIPHIAMVKKLK